MSLCSWRKRLLVLQRGWQDEVVLAVSWDRVVETFASLPRRKNQILIDATIPFHGKVESLTPAEVGNLLASQLVAALAPDPSLHPTGGPRRKSFAQGAFTRRGWLSLCESHLLCEIGVEHPHRKKSGQCPVLETLRDDRVACLRFCRGERHMDGFADTLRG